MVRRALERRKELFRSRALLACFLEGWGDSIIFIPNALPRGLNPYPFILLFLTNGTPFR